MEIISSKTLEYREKINTLSWKAEMYPPYVSISDKSTNYINQNFLCDISEGNAPYRPRYILPDYEKYLKNGSEYLNILPPKNLYEAINALMIIYQYVPSITHYPVFIGNLDILLEPFLDTVDETTVISLLKMFLNFIDRTLPDSFVHANIGPLDSRCGRIILSLEKELKKAVPNLSLKINSSTPLSLIDLAIETSLETGKPYFVNHDLICKDWGENYGIASCYNALKIGGGSFTLVRLNLKKAADLALDLEDFLCNVLPDTVDSLCEVINARARFIVEESHFFQSCFIAREGIIDINNFTSMAGIFGLFDAVEILSNGQKMGQSDLANSIAHRIMARLKELVKSHDGAYCHGLGGKIGLHSQTGIESDEGVSAGVRFRSGEEPELIDQILIQAGLQQYFDAGVSDIYVFDKTAKENVSGIRKIILGALKNNMKIMTFHTQDSDLIRISGFLVKKSEIQKLKAGKSVREDTTILGSLSIDNNGILNRKVRSF